MSIHSCEVARRFIGFLALGVLLFFVPRVFGLATGSPGLWLAGGSGYLVGYGVRALLAGRD